MDSRLSGPDASLNAPVSESESDVSARQDFLGDDAPQPDETVAEQIDTERRMNWPGAGSGGGLGSRNQRW